MRQAIVITVFLAGVLHASVTDRMIANMFMLGFEGKRLDSSSSIVNAVCKQGLGGVLLFKKNVSSPGQVRAMTSQLSMCPHKPLIAVDQEGGKVRRIRFGHEYGRASEVAKMGTKKAGAVYERMAHELHDLGINYNLAPVADLDIEPRNYIIHKLGRSYGSDPQAVTTYNSTFIRAMHKYHVLTSLKHFPGHGSSLGDTHRGFVDVTNTWSEAELKPFWNHAADSVMMAHVVNRRIDPSGLPMSLSPKAIRLLRRHNRNVVVITDDLQMGAIRKYYNTAQILQMAINAGDDILLFGNQLTSKHKVSTKQLIGIVRSLLASGKVSERSIKNANRRISRMRGKIGLPKSRYRKTHPVPKKHIPSPKKKSKAEQDLY